jgi:cytosolic carboxypeptidase protein 2/3
VEFDSSFECGNLDMAVRVKKNEFDLFLRSDTNTRGHTSWYYFKVNNRDLLGEVQLNICNFGKKKNLYAEGMKPYEMREGGEWRQEGSYEVC